MVNVVQVSHIRSCRHEVNFGLAQVCRRDRHPVSARWGGYRLVARLLLVTLLLAGCGSGSTSAVETPESQVITPLILSIQDAPVPFVGSDGHTHLVYELWMLNFTSVDATVEQVEVL
jgi:hypothetical protein